MPAASEQEHCNECRVGMGTCSCRGASVVGEGAVSPLLPIIRCRAATGAIRRPCAAFGSLLSFPFSRLLHNNFMVPGYTS